MLLLQQSKRITYTSPILDPFFLATNRTWVRYRAEWEYFATNSFSLMACYDSYQICNPSNGKCGAVTGINDLKQAKFGGLDFNSAQRAMALRFVQASRYGGQFVNNAATGVFGMSSPFVPSSSQLPRVLHV